MWAESVPRAMNLTCIRSAVHEADQPRNRPLDGDPVATTSMASAVSACVFAHRAIWFRFLPMRVTGTVRSRSMTTARAGIDRDR